jgi:uncharacterized membrane protein
VSFDHWILALHVLSAFSLVAGITLFWVIIVDVRRLDTPEATLRLGPAASLAGAAVGLGAGGTIVFGIWLALSYGDYDLWDGWIIVAIVLWVVMTALGQRTNAAYAEGTRKALELKQAGQSGPNAELLAANRTSTGVVLQLLASLVILLILIDMIWKPGA